MIDKQNLRGGLSMNYQLVLIGLVVLCVLLFLIQWFRQVRHALRGATRPLRTHAFFNWCLLIVAVLAGAGVGASANIDTEAAAGRQVAESSSAKPQQQSSRRAKQPTSSSQAEQSKAVAVNNNRQGSQDQSKPAPLEKQQLKLDQNGHATNNFPVPAKNQLQIVDAATGDVLQTFPGQPDAGTVNYTFNKEGNYYLIYTDGTLAKTTVVTVSR